MYAMTADIEKAQQVAERVRGEYNPDNISPFPYQSIVSKVEELKIYFSDLSENSISGAITYNQEKKIFTIIIDSSKPSTRQHFTLAHELGHYFLHKDDLSSSSGEWYIDSESNLDGGRTFFRQDNPLEKSEREKEANNFAACLIMPVDLVVDAWEKLHSIEECAKIFNVSLLAMAIRLEKLGLIKE